MIILTTSKFTAKFEILKYSHYMVVGPRSIYQQWIIDHVIHEQLP